jgi:peroxin-5
MRLEFFGDAPIQPSQLNQFNQSVPMHSIRTQTRLTDEGSHQQGNQIHQQGPGGGNWSMEFIQPTATQYSNPIHSSQPTIHSRFQPKYSQLTRPIQPSIQSIQPSIQPDESVQSEQTKKDWEKQFHLVEQSLQQSSEQLTDKQLTDEQLPDKQLTDEQFVKELQDEFQELATDDTDFFEKFNNSWKNGTDLNQDVQTNDTGNYWDDDYNPNPTSQTTNYDPDPVTAPLKLYQLEDENPFLDTSDAMEEGLRLWHQGGQLSAAALCFESVVRSSPDNSLAWMYLGQVQAENEKEDAAIAALQKCVQLDPENTGGLMSLAVCYTNEGFDMQAYATLYRWMRSSHPEIVGEDLVIVGTDLTPRDVHSRVTKVFLEAARGAKTVDADVQVGLGVLFYNHGDYEKAVDCFGAALSVRPDDYTLWNRLGATLANSGRSEEAISAYDRALDIKPTFVRGRYNLGVSCINIGVYTEAAEHLLGALSMHVLPGGEDGNVSVNLWDTLRRTFMLMDRKDLADLCRHGTDLKVFRDAGFEF